MQTNRRHISESPDDVYIGKKGDEHNAEIPTNQLFAEWRQANAYPFVYSIEFDALFIGDERDKHQEMRQDMLTGLYNIMADRGMEINPGTESHMRHYLAQLLDRNSDEGVMGRVWTSHKIISFWKFPDKAVLRKIINRLENEIGDMDGYRVDTNDGLVPLSQILYGNDTIQTNFDLSKIHTMGAKGKHDTPQLRGARDSRDSLKAQKLGNTPEVEYNFYRRYGMGDSVQRSGRHLNESPDSVYIDDELNLSYEDDDAYPFIYDLESKQLFLSGEGNTHEWIENEIEKYLKQNTDWYETDRGKVHNFIDRVLSRKTDSSVIGRLWYCRGVISFWKMPKTQSALKETIDALCRDCNHNIWDYDVELDTGLTPLKSLLHKDKPKETHFNLNTIHNLSPKEKWNTPQLKGARDSKDRKNSEKLGEMPQAKYNFYKNYGLGDSIDRTSTGQVNEVETDDVSLNSFKIKDELNPKFWLNNKLNSKVRQRLLDIAGDFMDETAIKWIKPDDIVLTGSMANYNWSRYSDVDVHIMVDYKKVYPKDPDFVEDYFDAKKELWADMHEGLKIYGYPVEIYVEDTNKKNTSTGIYSLNKNKWIVEPGDFEDATINASYVKKEAAKIMTEIDKLIKRAENTNDDKKLDKCSEDLKKIFDKLKKIRRDGLTKGGEMSSGNIIWKICRRMGYLNKLWDSVNKSYDRVNSIR